LLLGGLNLVRALGMAGIPAIVASSDARSPALASRYCVGRCPLPPLEPPQAALDTLLAAGERLADTLGRPVPMFYGNDDALGLITQHRDGLQSHFSLVLNDPDVASALFDKERFAPFARSRGLPVPRQLDWESLRGWTSPVLVKPKLKLDWDHAPVHVRLFGRAGKALVFDSGQALAEHPVARQLQHELIIQEYVPGDDRDLWSFHGYADEHSELLAWFVGRKLRTYPARTGVSTYLELAHDDELAQIGRQVAARVPLKGVFKMDFKKNAQSGEWLLLEINARFNLWHYLAARNGLNLPGIAYDYLVHGTRPATAARYRTRYRWLSLRADYRAYRDLAGRRELGVLRWLASLVSHPKVYELFSWSDPRPFLSRLQARIPRLTGRLWRWLSTAS
jgi:predicted ATP-grasp superfamily ATP-dependent carboligase